MTLDQLQDLKLWHQQHMHRQPVEKHLWDVVLTLWLAGCVGGPVAILVHTGWLLPVCLGLVFLPGSYVGLRQRLHRAGTLRCDWIGVVR
ncbi:MAG: hypothetical protein M3Z29_16875 [Pseudomonadota bacterium]|nr:hypothetical protein [Pseudomonadota bacterium]